MCTMKFCIFIGEVPGYRYMYPERTWYPGTVGTQRDFSKVAKIANIPASNQQNYNTTNDEKDCHASAQCSASVAHRVTKHKTHL